MLCYCCCCRKIFKSSLSHSKKQIPEKCPYCRKKVWKNEKGEKVPAVREATQKEEKRYRQEISYILDVMDEEDELDGY